RAEVDAGTAPGSVGAVRARIVVRGDVVPQLEVSQPGGDAGERLAGELTSGQMPQAIGRVVAAEGGQDADRAVPVPQCLDDLGGGQPAGGQQAPRAVAGPPAVGEVGVVAGQVDQPPVAQLGQPGGDALQLQLQELAVPAQRVRTPGQRLQILAQDLDELGIGIAGQQET